MTSFDNQKNNNSDSQESVFKKVIKKLKPIHLIFAILLIIATFNFYFIKYVVYPIAERNALETHKEALKEQIEILNKQIKTLEDRRNDLINKNKEIIELTEKYEAARSFGDSLKNQLKKTEFELNLEKKDKLTYRKQVDEKDYQVKRLKNQANKNIEQIIKLESEIKVINNQIKFYKNEISRLQGKNSYSEKPDQFPARKDTLQNSIDFPKVSESVSNSISKNDVEKMIQKFDFYDCIFNKYSKGSQNKFEASYRNDNEIVKDNVNGLIWQKCGSQKRMNYKEGWISEHCFLLPGSKIKTK